MTSRRLLLILALAATTLPLASPAAAVFPGDNGTLYVETDDAMTAIDPDGTIRDVDSPTSRAALETASLSPDGRQLIAETGGGDTDTFPLEAEDFSEVERQPEFTRSPAWSPTEPGVYAYVRFSEEVYVRTVGEEGDGDPIVTVNPEADGGIEKLEWSVDGTLYGYGDLFGTDNARLFTIDVDAGTYTTTEIVNEMGGFPRSPIGSLSPDGTRLAYECESTTQAFAGGPSNVAGGICLFGTDGTRQAVLRPLPSGSLEYPVWSPDGTRIAFVDDNDDMVYTMAADGTDPVGYSADGFNIIRGLLWAQVPTDPPPPPPSNNTLACGGFDGDAATTERADYADPTLYAVAVSQARFACDGSGQAQHVVLSRDDAFPDSLVGAALTGEGPLLFTGTDALPTATFEEITRAVPAGGTVYLLGGTAAISQAVEDQLRTAGYDVRRLAGPSRVETSVEVAREVLNLAGAAAFAGAGGPTVAIARAGGPAGNPTAGWADSVTAGAWTAAARVPTVVTDTAGVHPAVEAFLGEVQPDRTVLFGGTAALSRAVEDAVPNPQRIAGASRADTARLIASELIGEPDDGTREAVAVNGFRDDGWLFGLPAAGLAADTQGPIALVTDPLPPETGQQLCSPDEIDVLLAGGLGIITEATATAIDTTPSC